MNIYLTAIVNSKPEHVEKVKAILEALVVESRKEPACIQYDLHQSIAASNIFTFHEIWESMSGLDNHNQQPYIASFVAQFDELLEQPVTVYQALKIA
ncbi:MULTISPECIES: putative quinol monooxygenase [unclassified Arcicella]|uniref:putative quinol monooxygenase n=1 Tax=unclassified Arcicella TaxID=2644986 RepID=UPI0028639D59|nr:MULTISPECIES: putative quinol monooxygenase [unclassified Arcicella]MDR6561619.1 quinol monooxygenase YgiN [Arcicella sp. BE51]MDR6812399.1 quinol monooxygenase YgiN [Arcicella sp. BE140]MDR6823829.1 quinol monooxygenase YgiN [Arcicella sp. BE139]